MFVVLKIWPVVNGLARGPHDLARHEHDPTGNGPEPAQSTSRAVLGPSQQPVGRARHNPFSSARSGPVVGPFSPARHDTARKLK
jgi:hypothetical protein